MVDKAAIFIKKSPPPNTPLSPEEVVEGARIRGVMMEMAGVETGPSMRLEPTDEAKVRDIQRQAAEHKAALGEVQMRYDRQKAVIMDMLNRCDTRAASIVGEAALAKGLDPATAQVDWNTYTFVTEKKP